jgi:MFS family permease
MLAYWLVISRLANFGHWPELGNSIAQNPIGFVGFIMTTLVLSAVNVLSETSKWHILIQTTHKQPFKTSLKQTFGGMALGTLSPGRIAEPVGKMWRLPSRSKYHALALSIFGSFLQNAVILSFGAFSAFWVIKNQHAWPSFSWSTGNIAIVAVLAIALLLSAVLAKPFLKWLVRRFKMHRVLIGLNHRRLTLAALATIGRYLCFSSQLAIALIVLANILPGSFIKAMCLVPLYYALVTLAPSFLLTDLGVRGSAAIIVFAPLTPNYTPIIIAVFLVWLLNTLLPALVGLMWVSPFKKGTSNIHDGR